MVLVDTVWKNAFIKSSGSAKLLKVLADYLFLELIDSSTNISRQGEREREKGRSENGYLGGCVEACGWWLVVGGGGGDKKKRKW